jgi:hypothetical protein
MSFHSLKYFIERHKQHLLTVSFVLGFLIDNITLNRVDQLFDNALLLTHITVAMASLLCLYAASAGKLLLEVFFLECLSFMGVVVRGW